MPGDARLSDETGRPCQGAPFAFETSTGGQRPGYPLAASSRSTADQRRPSDTT